ncbi:MAG: hydrogenase maturation nickel metallochaperone HypA, partial [Candidatus Odinarchaeia archaeon]
TQIVVKMHEFSTAQAILNTILDAAKRYDSEKILQVNLEIGEFTLLNYSQLKFAIKTLSEGTIAEGVKVKIKTIKGKIKCNNCGYEGSKKVEETDHFMISFSPFTCPKCGSPNTDIIGGRETNIKDIKLKLKTAHSVNKTPFNNPC